MNNIVLQIIQFIFSLSILFSTEKYPLNFSADIQDILFKNQYVFFITDQYIYPLNTEKRTFLIPLSKPLLSTIGISNNSFLICEWKNFSISSPEEYSTKILIYERDKKDKTEIINIHPTVKPINCSKDMLYLETALPELEKKNFRYIFESEKLEEIPLYKEKAISSWTNIFKNITIKREINNIIWIYRKVPRL